MAITKEAQARIKINKLLEEAGWRFFDEQKLKANVVLEPNVKLTRTQIDELGDNFEDTKNGFVDFLLLDEKGYPLVILEAKSEDNYSQATLNAVARKLNERPRKTLNYQTPAERFAQSIASTG